MISTYDIKQQQFSVFRTGNKDSKEVILIIGSCRSIPYVNYLDKYNKSIGEKYLIYMIDPFNYNWNENDEFVDMEEVITALENDNTLLNIFKSTKIFIHEYYSNFGMFNCSKDAEKNIYKFGMNPELDITVPNFHDCFILFNDFFNLDPDFKLKAIQDYNESGKLSYETQLSVFEAGQKNIKKFLENCAKTDFPEMVEHFKKEWLNTRFFCSFNHISGAYSLKIFELMNDKFLHFDIDFTELAKMDLFGNTATPLCEYDLLNRAFNWSEAVVNFKNHNKI